MKVSNTCIKIFLMLSLSTLTGICSAFGQVKTDENIALHSAVNADSQEESAHFAVDGNSESYWQSGSSVGNHSLEVNLGAFHTIDRVVLPLVTGVDSLVLDVHSSNGWQTVFRGKPDNPLIGFDPQNTNRIRLRSIDGKQVRIYEVQVFAYNPQPVFVNQSGYDLKRHKRFTAPLAGDGTPFVITHAEEDQPLFKGKIKGHIGDFTSFQPQQDDGPYVIRVNGKTAKGISVPFAIGPNWMEKISYKPAVDFMVDVRCWNGDARKYHPTDKSPGCPTKGVAWRDATQFSFEIQSLLELYFSNPSAFSVDRMPVQGAYLGLSEQLPDDTPELVRMIYWATDIYLRGKVNHTLLKEQLAYFLYAYPWLSDYIPRKVYENVRNYLFPIWGNKKINRWRWHNIEHNGNLFQTYTQIGTGKGQFPPGHSIVPNLMMYEVARRERRPDAKRYFQAAYSQTQWIIKHLDWQDPTITKGQRQGEWITLTSLAYFQNQYPKRAPEGLQAKINEWAEVAIKRSQNMWDFRRYSDKRWIIPTIWPDRPQTVTNAGFNEPGNVAGFPAPALAAASALNNKSVRDSLRLLATAQIDNVFGRNPTGRQYSFDGVHDFEGVDLGWFQELQGGYGQLQGARGVLDGSPKETTYPYDPHAGDPGHTEGWVTFNTAWNAALAYESADMTFIDVYDKNFQKEISAAKPGEMVGIVLTAPLNMDYNKKEHAEAVVYLNGDKKQVELEEISKSSSSFRGVYKIPREIITDKIKIAYGFAWHEKAKSLNILSDNTQSNRNDLK